MTSNPSTQPWTNAVIDGSGVAAPSSRAATNELLANLKAGKWRADAWWQLLVDASKRSVEQARARPQALLEMTALHLGFAAGPGRRGWKWVLMVWFLAATHLGLLEERKSLGTANLLTLTRANLPATEHVLGRLVPVLALASDFIDGKLARATKTETAFGKYADFLADTALWTWFSLRHEPSRIMQVATLAAWAAPVVAIISSSFAHGRMIDAPRRRWFRPAAAAQVLLGVRMLRRWTQQTPQP
jgi:phosphatidylglycerophosphate synthase